MTHLSMKGFSAMNHAAPMSPALATIAAKTDYLRTEELANILCRASQTIRKAYCLTGHYLSIRPVKLGNRLLWPIKEVAKVLAGGAQ